MIRVVSIPPFSMRAHTNRNPDSATLPQIGKSRDHSDLQDMYRRALAASWASQEGEFPADQCIEEIFAGGDGWKPDSKARTRSSENGSESGSGEGSPSHVHNHNHWNRHQQSGTSSKSQNTKAGGGMAHKQSRGRDSIGRAAGIQSNPSDISSQNLDSDRGRSGFGKPYEVDEFECRDDLVAWRLPSNLS